jgi:hypothetical protein
MGEPLSSRGGVAVNFLSFRARRRALNTCCMMPWSGEDRPGDKAGPVGFEFVGALGASHDMLVTPKAS